MFTKNGYTRIATNADQDAPSDLIFLVDNSLTAERIAIIESAMKTKDLEAVAQELAKSDDGYFVVKAKDTFSSSDKMQILGMLQSLRNFECLVFQV